MSELLKKMAENNEVREKYYKRLQEERENFYKMEENPYPTNNLERVRVVLASMVQHKVFDTEKATEYFNLYKNTPENNRPRYMLFVDEIFKEHPQAHLFNLAALSTVDTEMLQLNLNAVIRIDEHSYIMYIPNIVEAKAKYIAKFKEICDIAEQERLAYQKEHEKEIELYKMVLKGKEAFADLNGWMDTKRINNEMMLDMIVHFFEDKEKANDKQ